MFLEARVLSHEHGTCNHGHSYTILDVKKRQCFCLGLRELGGADAQTQLYLFKVVLDEIEVNQKQRIYYQSCYKYPEFGGRQMCHTKKIEIFTKCKKELLLRVTKTCHKLPKEYQQALGNANEFFVAYIF